MALTKMRAHLKNFVIINCLPELAENQVIQWVMDVDLK